MVINNDTQEIQRDQQEDRELPQEKSNQEFQPPLEKHALFVGARAQAVRVLSRFERSDSYIDKLIDYELKTGNLSQLDKSLFTELVNGVIRWKGKLDYVLVGFYQGDYMKCLNIVKNALRVALYQIMFLTKIPAFAAINESVEVVKQIQGDKTAGIVNGVLRTIMRNIENIRYPEIEEDPVYYFSVMYSHPRWMIRRWLDRFGTEETEKLLFKNNHRPYIPFRVNSLKGTREEVTYFLDNNEIPYFIPKITQNSVVVKSTKLHIANLEIFERGLVTVQDPAAALAAQLAAPQKGQSILDLCAAPGGKSFYLAELTGDTGKIIAVDRYPVKLKLIEDGAARLGIKSITTILGDARNLELEEQFDIVFADVPCSGTGVLAKKPDIKWKKEREDVYQMAELQKEILNASVNKVKPGGVLIYSTCSLEPEENTMNADWFIETHPEFQKEDAADFINPYACKDGYLQTLPHFHHTDGAFAARFKKKMSL
jgi:16S rRNA (cytosine967-C5)-methyltransferase